MEPSRKRTHTRPALRQALGRLLEQKHLAEITVAELCREANVNRSTFYRHYDIPQDILEELWQELDGHVLKSLQQLPPDAPLEASVSAWCRPIYADRAGWAVLLKSDIHTAIPPYVPSAAQEASYSSRGLNAENTALLFQLLMYGSAGLVQEWVSQPDPMPPETFARYITNIWRLFDYAPNL